MEPASSSPVAGGQPDSLLIFTALRPAGAFFPPGELFLGEDLGEALGENLGGGGPSPSEETSESESEYSDEEENSITGVTLA